MNKPIPDGLARYTKTSLTLGSMITKLAGEKYLGLKINRERHASNLKNILGQLKGPLMKVAQLLATIPGALPPEYLQELQQLQCNAPVMGWLFVKRRMMTELGKDWEKEFKDFSHEAIHAASLGQVHKATALDGTSLACKLQYPDMDSVVTTDLKQLKFILGLFEKYDRSISTQQIQAELSERLREELDYEREARHLYFYAQMLKKEPHVHVPDVLDKLSTKRLLTMRWLEGTPLLEKTESDQDMRNTIAINLFHAWYVPFYKYGLLHGDPHPGNYTVRPNGDINLLDFGCVRIFPASFVKGVLDLYRALRENDEDLAITAYETWGFKNLNKEVIETLNIWARFIYDPIMDNKKRLLGNREHGVYGRKQATETHRRLREIAGNLEIPREFVLMDRTTMGLGSIFLHLRAEVNWCELFQNLTQDFDPEELANRQGKLLNL